MVLGNGIIKSIGKSVAKETGENVGKGLGKKVLSGAGRALVKKAPVEAGTALFERLIPYEATLAGAGVLALGTMAAKTVNTALDTGNYARLGKVEFEENLDRLVSYDGTGFVEGLNSISDQEVQQDIVKHTFNNLSQGGASGDIVFALHNMRG